MKRGVQSWVDVQAVVIEKLPGRAWTPGCRGPGALRGVFKGPACGAGGGDPPTDNPGCPGDTAFSSSGLLRCGGVEWLEPLCQTLPDLLPGPQEARPAGAKEWGCSLPPPGGAGWLCGVPEPSGSGVPAVLV